MTATAAAGSRVCPELAYSPLGLCHGHESAYRLQGRPGGAGLPEAWFGRFEQAGRPVPVRYDDQAAFGRWCQAALPLPRPGHGQPARPGAPGQGRDPVGPARPRPDRRARRMVPGLGAGHRGRLPRPGLPGRPGHQPVRSHRAQRRHRDARRAAAGLPDTRRDPRGGLPGVRPLRGEDPPAGAAGSTSPRSRSGGCVTCCGTTPPPSCAHRRPRAAAARITTRGRHVSTLSGFLEARAPGGGHQPGLLGDEHAYAFAADLRHRASNGLPALGPVPRRRQALDRQRQVPEHDPELRPQDRCGTHWTPVMPTGSAWTADSSSRCRTAAR